MSLFQWLDRFSSANPAGGVQRPLDANSPPVRVRFRFSGYVQGVGFRYEARHTAGELGLTGWARNEYDGTVTVEAEGRKACVDEFLRVMQAVPRFDITGVQTETLPLSGSETSFKILY